MKKSLLLLFLVLLLQLKLQAKPDGECPCSFETYVTNDAELKVYDKPGGSLICTFDFTREADFEFGGMVLVDLSEGGWLRIHTIHSELLWQDLKGGWIAGNQLGIGTNVYDGSRIPLYKRPSTQSGKAAMIPGESYPSVMGCCRDWAWVVESDSAEGWLHPQYQCKAVVTNCN